MSSKQELRLKLSSGQMNKEVRKVLIKYQINLSCLEISTNSTSIFFRGNLIRNNGLDLPAHEILCLVDALSKIGEIRTELDNWYLSKDTICYLAGNQLDLTLETAT